MRLAIAAFLTVTLLVSASLMAQSMRAPGAPHPIVGKWKWTRAQNNCTEEYDFRLDGTLQVQSGAERTDNTYEIVTTPDSRGFYKITMKVVKDHGGKDCGDDESNSTGDEYTNYFLLEPSMSMYIACQKPSLEACFGPLRKVPQ
jgi:hypothetical protein